MRYLEFQTKLGRLLLFNLRDIFFCDRSFRKETLYEWQKKGLVTKIKNNLYSFSTFKPVDTDYYTLANKIVEPSYVSLESALSHYGLIPEAVPTITSVTTSKPETVNTVFGSYIYRKISPKLFFGYSALGSGNRKYKMAYREKAILDYLYLNPSIKSADDFEAMRLNKEEIKTLDFALIDSYLKLYSNKALSSRVDELKKYK